MSAPSLRQFSRLTTPEKIILLEELWDSVASDERSVPVPASHAMELDRRLARHRAGQGELLTLEELQRRVAKSRR